MHTLDGILANIYMPNTIEEIYMTNNSLPIIKENSLQLKSITVMYFAYDMNLKQEFFDSLKNAPNLESLSMRELEGLRVESLSYYLKYELPSVRILNLSGGSGSSTNSLLNDLKGIEKFTNLQTLTINYTSANLDISAIKNCPTLTKVSLTNCNIQSLSGIEALTNLQSLTLSNNNITGVKELENLTNLTGLNLENNLISDTSTYINEAGETVTYSNLEILANLNSNRNGKLTTLYLSGNDNIINWTPVSSLTWANKSGF